MTSGSHAAPLSHPAAVRGLCDELPAWASSVVEAAGRAGPHVTAALIIAERVGRAVPSPGRSATLQRWAVLDELARVNVAVARVVEAHTDALAILTESTGSGDVPASGTWGVFAAESGTDRLVATPTADAGTSTLSGTKPWCSLGGALEHALVTAWVDDDRRGLFAVDLHQPGVRARPAQGWVSRGLPTIVSVGVDFDGAIARAVGAPGWYLERPGFAWGGMGVAACWFGAARGVAEALRPRAGDTLRALAVGEVDATMHAAACVLRDAAARIDGGSAAGEEGAALALRVRSVVAAAAERVLGIVGRATGPAPLAFDETHAARVADLEIYLRQHHGERDLAALGSLSEGRS